MRERAETWMGWPVWLVMLIMVIAALTGSAGPVLVVLLLGTMSVLVVYAQVARARWARRDDQDRTGSVHAGDDAPGPGGTVVDGSCGAVGAGSGNRGASPPTELPPPGDTDRPAPR